MAERRYTIGSGITKRAWRDEPVDTPEKMAEMRASIDDTFRWDVNTRDTLEYLREIFDREYAVDHGRNWRRYVDEGWYAHMALIEHKNATAGIAKGDASAAACAAARFGDLMAEMRMKFRHEENAIRGAETWEQRRAGGAATRKGSDAERLACYRQFRAMGLNKTDATDQAAKKLGVAPATIRNARKGAGASD